MTERSIIYQNLYNEDYPPITMDCANSFSLAESAVDDFLDTVLDDFIGIAAGYDGSDGTMAAFALSSPSRVLLITFEEGWESGVSSERLVQNRILCKASYKKYGWNMTRLATALHAKSGLKIAEAFDIQSKSNRHTHGSMASMYAIFDGEEVTLDKANVAEVFQDEDFDPSCREKLGLRAWACCRVAMLTGSKSTIKSLSPISTQQLDSEHIGIFGKLVRDAERLNSLQPLTMRKEFDQGACMVDGNLQLVSSRYKNRIRPHEKYRLETVNGTFITGRVENVSGKTAQLSLSEQVEAKDIVSVLSTEREDRSFAQRQKRTILEKTLQKPERFFAVPFLQLIYLPSRPVHHIVWPQPERRLLDESVELDFDLKDLNDSQTKAVNHALSQERVTMILGPPGTGKTTVIAATVISIIEGTEDGTVWVIAESNVAVRNIAEKLFDCDFTDFRLLVSHEFSFEWHDHLYTDMAEKVIRSNDFAGSRKDNERLLGGVRVVLCTLSMASNPTMIRSGYTEMVPLRMLIVDEASQIEIGNYLPLLSQSSSSLEKIVFIGDDKQLAPFGQDEIKDLQSVFEVPHLRENAILLDTQYRLPHFIGDFISEHVYDGRLKTVHKIKSSLSCRLVDVQSGRQAKPGDGLSWINVGEVKAVVLVAKKYKTENRSYKVITPYDAQRSRIEQALRDDRLQWQDTVFTLDSFQGNEEDHLIISLVRSGGLGFLKNERRTNVMLTRCKLAMIICSSKKFLEGKEVAGTLVGKMAARCVERNGERAWISSDDLMKGTW